MSVDDVVIFLFFFFKQKTAYELRISDWSSDVCSSDLRQEGRRSIADVELAIIESTSAACGREPHRPGEQAGRAAARTQPPCRGDDQRLRGGFGGGREIGRASCRERVCQYA